MTKFSKISDAADFIFAETGGDISLATPLGLGKPNQLLNEIYDRAVADRSSKLAIYTALSLRVPKPSEDLARAFLGPFALRHWGPDYPDLNYFRDAARDRVPANIQVHEFYMQAGSALKSRHLQRNYQSVNYTHVAENVWRASLNVVVQLIAAKDGRYSLSCNPDLTLDVAELFNSRGKKLCVVGVVHPDLPFLGGEAEVPADFFDGVVESAEVKHELFALPRQPISLEDHLIGFYASLFVRDEGTLQIGIGSLSDAIVASLVLRQKRNGSYLNLRALLRQTWGETGLFVHGLYGLTEMLTDGFMHLRSNGILRREVTDEVTGGKTYLHGSFVLGSKPFYKWLRELKAEDAAGLRMTRVTKVNDLYDPNEVALRRQRIHPRFFNTTMQVSLLGEAMSETLPNGQVVSGVGGQYNFVAMSHELKDSRSVIMLRSYRVDHEGRRCSNLVWTPGHVTIPRHLRDVVITEYGVADVKGRTDEECICALLAITDSEFQDELLERAKADGKVRDDYEIPAAQRKNTPESLRALLSNGDARQAFVPFPFGSDFTPVEERLALALGRLQDDRKLSLFKVFARALSAPPPKFAAEYERMGLKNVNSLKERLYRRILGSYLNETSDPGV